LRNRIPEEKGKKKKNEINELLYNYVKYITVRVIDIDATLVIVNRMC